MNRKFVMLGTVFLLFALFFGCTSSDTFIISQAKLENLISNYSDLNYVLFEQGYYDGNFLLIDGNLFTVGTCE